jgi:hypothetical protein
MKTDALFIYLSMGVLGIGYGISYFIPGNSEKQNALYEKASIAADADKDGVTTTDEWKDVYKKLGIHYDERRPRKLSAGDLEKFLSD